MARKLKITGFTRFVMAMVFIVPIAYLVASYANGEDAIGNIKNTIGVGDRTETSSKQPAEATDTCDELQRQLEKQERRIEELEDENERLRETNR
ncbi:MAG: hypothetical protein AB8G22_13590 [Saprospiraceae bacterium]